jgi:hypothetical protein
MECTRPTTSSAEFGTRRNGVFCRGLPYLVLEQATAPAALARIMSGRLPGVAGAPLYLDALASAGGKYSSPAAAAVPAGNDELCDSPWCKGSRPGGCGGRGSSGGRLLIGAVTGFPAVTVTSSPWWRNANVASVLSRNS